MSGLFVEARLRRWAGAVSSGSLVWALTALGAILSAAGTVAFTCDLRAVGGRGADVGRRSPRIRLPPGAKLAGSGVMARFQAGAGAAAPAEADSAQAPEHERR